MLSVTGTGSGSKRKSIHFCNFALPAIILRVIKIYVGFVGLQVLIAVVMKSIVPCNPLKTNRRFGICRLHLQGRRISQARNQYEAGSKHSCESYILSKCQLPFSRLHGVISKMTKIWIGSGNVFVDLCTTCSWCSYYSIVC
jgi:hypothetical protein